MYRCEAFNPFATATSEWIDGFLRMTCADGLKSEQRSELDDQIEALVPALIELRDAGHIQLNAAALASFGTLEGFTKLASDGRLSELSRRRCEAIRVRLIVQGVKALLGHN
jgi:hypothetical protein